MIELGSGVDALFVAYLVAFGGAAVACFGSLVRVRSVDNPDTRRGLTALLLLSGCWAAAHTAFLLAPSRAFAVGFYSVDLVVGLATVGPWLYFCSAYSGRSLHQNARLRAVAVAVYLGIVAVKLTNPVHGLYFSVESVTTPFPYFAIQHGTMHWVVMGIAYTVTGIGFFMVFERFSQLSFDTRPLVVVTSLAGLPVVLDIVGFTSPFLVDINHEPLGIAAFSVGVLFVYLDRFQTVQIAAEHDDPLIVLDDQDRIREFNTSAAELFPSLRDAVGDPVWSTVPSAADAIDSESNVVELDRDGTHYYRVTESPFSSGQQQLGRFLVFQDVTQGERYRRELERQNERLEQFASMVAHDLRNPLNVAMGRVRLLAEERESEHLAVLERSFERMEALIDDMLTLARQGNPVEETEAVSLETIARRSQDQVATAEASVVVDGDMTFMADPDRLRQLFENLYRNAVEHAGPTATVRVGPIDDEGFYVADDGPGIPPEEREDVFESGYTTSDEGTGFGLAIVDEIVTAHGWTVTVVESDEGGARFEIKGVER